MQATEGAIDSMLATSSPQAGTRISAGGRECRWQYAEKAFRMSFLSVLTCCSVEHAPNHVSLTYCTHVFISVVDVLHSRVRQCLRRTALT